MSYIHFTRSAGSGISDYESVVAALGAEPITGRRAHWAGTHEGALCTVDVWDSRADADRFAAQRLFPAFERAGLHPPVDTQVVAFDAAEAAHV